MTPEQWRDALTAKQLNQRSNMVENERFYLGTQPLGFLDPEVERVTNGRVKPLNINFARLAIETLGQRIRVTGFRSSTGQIVDSQLLNLWQRNGMDEQSELAQRDCLIYGRAYFLVWADMNGAPVITAESPLQVNVARDPLTRRVIAGLKRWLDEDGYAHALLITEDTVTEWQSRTTSKYDIVAQALMMSDTWEQQILSEQLTKVREESNPLGIVPIVPLVNRPRLGFLDGESELSDLRGPLQAIGKLSTDMLLASEYAASPRRWATGLAPAGVSAEQMKVIEEHVRERWEKAHASKFLISSSPDARLGTFDTAELSNYRTAIELTIGEVASLSGLPAYYVNGNSLNPVSADSIRASESRLTERAKERQRWWSGPYEDLMRLATLVRDGQPDDTLADLETVWADTEPTSLSQIADAEAKLMAAGITDRRAALEALGYSPLDIERMLTTDSDAMVPTQRDLNLAETVQKVYLGVGKVITSDEARAIVNNAGADLPVPGPNFTDN